MLSAKCHLVVLWGALCSTKRQIGERCKGTNLFLNLDKIFVQAWSRFKKTKKQNKTQFFRAPSPVGRVFSTLQSRLRSGTCGAYLWEKAQLRFFDLHTANEVTDLQFEVAPGTNSTKQLIKSRKKPLCKQKPCNHNKTTILEIPGIPSLELFMHSALSGCSYCLLRWHLHHHAAIASHTQKLCLPPHASTCGTGVSLYQLVCCCWGRRAVGQICTHTNTRDV